MTRTGVGPAYVPWVFLSKVRFNAGVTTYVEHREFREDCTELFIEGVLRELNLAHIKVANATDLKVFVDDLWVGGMSKIKTLCHITADVQWVFSAESWIARYPRSQPQLALAR
jgi:hypothetical protein